MSDESAASFLFVVGTGRCGSTLILDLLAGHPDVGFVANGEGRPSEAYDLLHDEVSPLVTAPFRDLLADDATPWVEHRFRRFFTGRAQAQGRPVFVHKFTGWPRARFIEQALPGSRYLHVVRDGRAVANSLIQQPWWQGYLGPSEWRFGPLPSPYAAEWEEAGQSFVALAGIQWKLLLDAFADARDAVPAERWQDVRYEDLVGQPHETLCEILAFAGLPETPEFLANVDRIRIGGERQNAWFEELPRHEIERLDRSLAAHLELWGYR